ncbi:MAG TPA: NAD(P)H-binding protein [Moheibacter sp.]|nr:NAD(P)H-binding protein [Moheibacter sp.]
MKVLLIGATGATGSELLEDLLADESITEVITFVRRLTNRKLKKLTEVLVDFERLFDYQELMQGDVAISCLGTTLKQAGSKEQQWIVDHDYQLEFAQLTKKNNVPHFILLSAIGASPESKIFYNRMKGTLEVAVRNLSFSRLDLFQPSILIRPNSNRVGEKMGEKIFQILNALGLFQTYRPISVQDLAAAMKANIFDSEPGVFQHNVQRILKKSQ